MNTVIMPGSSIALYYDSTQARWLEGNQLEESGVKKETTAAQITSNQNNYDPSDYGVLRLSSDAARTITGLSGGVKGRLLRIFNVGSYAITLSNQSASSSAANRFNFSNAQDAVIAPGSNVALYYDSTQSRWIGGDTYSSGAVVTAVRSSGFKTIADTTETELDLGIVETDQYGFYDAGNDRIGIVFSGFYTVRIHVKWEVSADFAWHRRIRITARSSGGVLKHSIYDLTLQPDSGFVSQQLTLDAYLDAGDYCQFYAFQTSPAAASLDVEDVRVTVQRIA